MQGTVFKRFVAALLCRFFDSFASALRVLADTRDCVARCQRQGCGNDEAHQAEARFIITSHFTLQSCIGIIQRPEREAVPGFLSALYDACGPLRPKMAQDASQSRPSTARRNPHR